MEKETWYQVKFANANGMTGSIRVFNEEECKKLEKALPELGLIYAGYDILWAETAEAVIAKIRAELQLNPPAKILKIVKD